MELKAKIWIERGGKLVFGRGRAELLEATERTGSMSAAARELGMSYRHAWSMLRASEQRLGKPLLERRRGGAGGGGARLTPLGKALLVKFRSIEKEFWDLARKCERRLRPLG